MNYPSIRIEGAILSPDILDRLEDLQGQRPADFGIPSPGKVKDEIARAWADAQDYWRIYQRKIESLRPDSPATTETRNLWIVPLLGLLGYQLEYQHQGIKAGDKSYPISHRTINRALGAVHITGYRDPAGLDRKPERAAGPRMSAHALVQEYLNLSDQLFAIVTNGKLLRLLRDSSRLVKLTYLEFDLDRIFTDGLFADFAVLYRLLHATRMPISPEAAAESLIERYHQDSVDSGARIRDGLSRAVEEAILAFANGLLAHPANQSLRDSVQDGSLKPDALYQHLLRLIYRLLFLLVIEERNLVYPLSPSAAKRDLYYRYYSLQRLRRLAERRYLADPRHDDLWLALLACFRLFEDGGPGPKLGIAPLAGDLFGPDAIGPISACRLDNRTVLECLRSLSLYQHPDTNQVIRVSYAALNVEEFGSVYEGLLEYEPVFQTDGSHITFAFAQGDERAATGSHYTPDDLVQPLLKHSLDYLIADKLKEADKAKALLSLRVADIACGSGHILLAAARRIATELAIVRTGEEQPSPAAFRAAIRDVIRECIYGVDLNPLAVELCKVALWLEAHSPGEPLNFLDHHIKCGNAIVGFTRREELEQGIPDEAFVTMPGDDKTVAASLRKKNKEDRAYRQQQTLEFSPELQQHLAAILARFRELSGLPERNPAEIDRKKKRYEDFIKSADAWLLNQIAAIPIAQFYLPKTQENRAKFITDEEFRAYLGGQRTPQGQATAAAWAWASRKRFFHWFLEFPDIIARGGFDCILGNPPYLGGRNVGLQYGQCFSNYTRYVFPSAEGNCDLVAVFLLRAFHLLRDDGYGAFLATKTIAQGETRKAGLQFVLANGGQLIFAQRSIRWPGKAAVVISQIAIVKSRRPGAGAVLDGRNVRAINSFLEEADTDIGADPKVLSANANVSFKGSEPSMGFVLDRTEAASLIRDDPKCREVLFEYINGDDLNSRPDQRGSRYVISFFDWPEVRAAEYKSAYAIAKERVYSLWAANTDQSNTKQWWWHRRRSEKLYSALRGLSQAIGVGFSSKYGRFSVVPVDVIFSNLVVVVCSDDFGVYAILDSAIHEVWAWKYASRLGESTLRYTPSVAFETFPLPLGTTADLKVIGEQHHEHRRQMMGRHELGITALYNLFHSRNVSDAVKELNLDASAADTLADEISKLRSLQIAMDEAVLAAYGWSGAGGITLAHDFHEVETLPENDRVRYTISPTARKEVLKRLLALNHARATAEEAAAAKPAAKPKRERKKAQPVASGLFFEPVPIIDAIELLVTILDELKPTRVQQVAAERIFILAVNRHARELYEMGTAAATTVVSQPGNPFKVLWQSAVTLGYATISPAGMVQRTDLAIALTKPQHTTLAREAVVLFKKGEALKRAWPLEVDDVEYVVS